MAVKIDVFRLTFSDWRRLIALLIALAVVWLGGGQRGQAQDTSTVHYPTTPLFWAEGITRTADFEAYTKCGLNTVVVRVPWRPTPDGSLTPQDLIPVKAFAQAAADKGLNVIYALPATPQGFEDSMRVSADGQAYFALWEAWAGGVIQMLKDTPRLTGWMLPDDPRGLNYADDAAFAHWLNSNYANARVLNIQWDANFASLDAVTLPGAQELADRFRRGNELPDTFTQEQLNEAMAQDKKPPSAISRTWAFHPAALFMAQFRWDAWRTLVSGWARRVRAFDPAHPIFSGRLPDYAQMLALPAANANAGPNANSNDANAEPGVDFSVPAALPSVAERDLITHNPQAVTIARRGGRLRAIPVLQSEASETLPEAQLPLHMPTWIEAQWSRGASGIAFSSWAHINSDAALQKAITTELTKLNAPPLAADWGRAPISTAALVLTPLADAYQLQIGGAPRGLYGFGSDLSTGEPGDLVWALRWGTAFGSIDVLAPDDVMSGTVSLTRYNTLLLPNALSLPDEETRALGNYVRRGGVVVADLGAGALQNGGSVATLSPGLRELFGVTPTSGPQLVGKEFSVFAVVRPWSGNLRLLTPHSLLPSFSGTNDRANRGVILTAGDGPNGTAFTGAAASFDPQGAEIVAQAGNSVDGLHALLTFNALGNGFAGFTPFPLWSNWRPGGAGFDAFHGDLFNRGAAIVASNVSSFVPAAPGAGAPRYPEIVNFPDAVALFNHATEIQPCAVLTGGVGRFLWSNCLTMFAPSSASLSGGRPAPIADADDFEREAHAATLYARPDPGAMVFMRLRPIRAQNLAGGPICASIVKEEPKTLDVVVWPNTTSITSVSAGWNVDLGDSGRVRLQVFDAPDGYRVAPNSRHRITVTDIGGPLPAGDTASNSKTNRRTPAPKPATTPPRTFDLQADARGSLQIEVAGKAIDVKVTPL